LKTIKAIKLKIERQGQWRAGKKDPQTSWIMGSEGKAPTLVNPSPPKIHIDYSDSQVPSSEDYLYYDPDYPIEAYAL
jgi:hypothetical protein